MHKWKTSQNTTFDSFSSAHGHLVDEKHIFALHAT